MAHALTIHREVVALRNRAQYFERLRAKLAYYTAANCRFWVFEEISLPGAFVEFTEADTAQTLAAAHAAAPWRLLDPGRIYKQVEIV